VVPKADLRKETNSEHRLETAENPDRDTAQRTFITYYLADYYVIRLRLP